MDISLISERYAKALLDYAVSRKQEEVVYNEMRLLSESFYLFKNLYKTIVSPFTSVEQRDSLIITAAGGKVSDVFINFISLVKKQNRLSCLHEMSLKYCDLYRRSRNIHYCKLTTAVSIDDEELEKIRSTISLLTEQDAIIEIHRHVDKRIIGGFIFEIDSKLMNKSVSYQLQRIRAKLTSSNQSIV